MAQSAADFITEQDIPNALARVAAAHDGPTDHHWYEPRWDKRLQKIANMVSAGETSLARVVARVMAVDRDPLEEPVGFFWRGQRVEMNHLLMGVQRLAVFNSIITRACRPETDSVIELGAGDGLNLFGLWLGRAPRAAHYMAFEITNIGQLCTELLGKLQPDMHVSAHAYDYYSPNYDAVPAGQRHLVVFTNGSVEQIDKLPRAVIEGLLDKADSVSGVHFEPVGWQVPGADPEVSARHRERCLGLGYNENLWSMLNELQDEGRLKLDLVEVNLFGKLKHPSTLITWHK